MADDTLALLRRIDAAGAMPDEWDLHETMAYPMSLFRRSEVQGHSTDDGRWWWYDGGDDLFIVALQRKLATMGVTAFEADCGDGGEPWWCAQRLNLRVHHDPEFPGLVWDRPFAPAMAGPGVDGLMRAALAVLEKT